MALHNYVFLARLGQYELNKSNLNSILWTSWTLCKVKINLKSNILILRMNYVTEGI